MNKQKTCYLDYQVALFVMSLIFILISSRPTGAQESKYMLPYPAGKGYLLTQGNDSGEVGGTHDGKGKYAFDFGIPHGSSIVASREGRVLYVKQNSNEGGCQPSYFAKANYIIIDHGDGTSALYLHLKYNSVVVEEGDWVESGQEIGLSNASGYVCGVSGNHLHFQVQTTPKSRQYWYSKSIPISFSDEDVISKQPDGVPRGRITYRSGNRIINNNTTQTPSKATTTPQPEIIPEPITKMENVWPMYRHDAKHSGMTSYNGPEAPELRWVFKNEKALSPPVISADGTVYIASSEGILYSLDTSGNKKWTYSISGVGLPKLAILHDGNILAGRGDTLYAFEPDGSLLWTYTVSQSINDVVIGTDGNVYISSNCVHAVKPDGTQIWGDTHGVCEGSGGFKELAISQEGNIYGLSTLDVKVFNPEGAFIWEENTAFFAGARGGNTAITIDPQDNAYVNIDSAASVNFASPNAQVIILFSHGGVKNTLGPYISIPPAVTQEGSILFGKREVGETITTENGVTTSELGKLEIIAMKHDGLVRWEQEVDGSICSYPVVDGKGNAYFILNNGDIHSYSPNGTLRWKINVMRSKEYCNWTDWNLAIGNKIIYLSTERKLFAIGEVIEEPVVVEEEPEGEMTSKWQLVHRDQKADLPDKNFEMVVNYPFIEGDDTENKETFNAQIESLVQTEIDKMHNKVHDMTFLENVNMFSEIDYKITTVKDGGEVKNIEDFPENVEGVESEGVVLDMGHKVMSILFTNFWYTGGAHPGTYHRAINYDFTAVKKLSLSDLFIPSSSYLYQLSEYCIQQLGEKLDFEVWEDGAAPLAKNYQVWTITRKGLLIVFEEYQVAPYSSGPQSVFVPYTVITNIIDPEGPIGWVVDNVEEKSLESAPTEDFESFTCPGLIKTRLWANGYAYVNPEPPMPNLVRIGPDTDRAAVGQIPPGGIMEVLDGPECGGGYTWWKVRALDTGIIGWTAEGDSQSYWIIPCASIGECSN